MFFVDDEVDGDVVIFAVFADDLPFVDLFGWFDEEEATVEESIEGIGGDLA